MILKINEKKENTNTNKKNNKNNNQIEELIYREKSKSETT
jgi:hypothetical protein